MKITFIEYDGTAREVEAAQDGTLRDVALDNLVPGIDGDCGGDCACATCHVFIDDEWQAKLTPLSDDEDTMLALCDDRTEASRLGCQIKLGPELDGLVVRTPEGQH
jgi:2Fe-2S ferredoxin